MKTNPSSESPSAAPDKSLQAAQKTEHVSKNNSKLNEKRQRAAIKGWKHKLEPRVEAEKHGSAVLTSLRAFSNFGLLSSTLSLDCCFNFRSIAVTEIIRWKK